MQLLAGLPPVQSVLTLYGPFVVISSPFLMLKAHVAVSKNGGYPKNNGLFHGKSHLEMDENWGYVTPISSILMSFSLINHPFGSTPMTQETSGCSPKGQETTET